MAEGVELTVYGLEVGGTIALQAGWNLVGPVGRENAEIPVRQMPQYTDTDGTVKAGTGAIVQGAFYRFNGAGYVSDVDTVAKARAGNSLFLIGEGYWVQTTRKVNIPAAR
jgi:hypothetical protein